MRIRSIKPEVLKHEGLWDLGASTGLPIYQAFTGLWMEADREGRFEWRPRMLRTEILPYWDGDFADVLAALEGAGFVVRYEVDGKAYGFLPGFREHQCINKNEARSRLPEPPVNARALTFMHGDSLCGREREGKGKEGEGNCSALPRMDERTEPTPDELAATEREAFPNRGGHRTSALSTKAADLAAILNAFQVEHWHKVSTLQLDSRAPTVAPHLEAIHALVGSDAATVAAAARSMHMSQWWVAKKMGAPTLKHFAERFESYCTQAHESGQVETRRAGNAKKRADDYEAAKSKLKLRDVPGVGSASPEAVAETLRKAGLV